MSPGFPTGGPSAVSDDGDRVYRRIVVAMFAAGFATFASINAIQPVLPAVGRDFQVTPTQSSLALSLTTGFMAVAMLAAGGLAERFGHKPLMAASIVSASVLGLISAAIPQWPFFLAARALLGLSLCGMPSIAMAYIGDKVRPAQLGQAMGLYVGGSATGAMASRLLTALVADVSGSWRLGLALVGGLSLAAAVVFIALLPQSGSRPVAASGGLKSQARLYRRSLSDPVMRRLFGLGFLLMGCAVASYNYIGFRLASPPYDLPPRYMALLFLGYAAAPFASLQFGRVARRIGRRRAVQAGLLTIGAGLAATLATPLWAVAAGLLVLTGGFFGAHAVCSAWVGGHAASDRAQATTLYLMFYYLGGSTIGSVAGLFWSGLGWLGVAGLLAAAVAMALAVVRSIPEMETVAG